jgi:sphinganine-1-phosphate aldolase
VNRLGFEIVGNPMLGLMAFSHPDVHAFAVYGEIFRRGWFTSVTKEPPSLHLMLSPKHADVADAYLADLEASLAAVKAGADGPKVEARYS